MTPTLLTLYAVSGASTLVLGLTVMRSGSRTPARRALGIFLLATLVWTAQAVWGVLFPATNPVVLVAWTMPVAAVVVAHARTMVHAMSDASWRATPRDVLMLGAHPVIMAVIACIPALQPSIVVMRDGEASYGTLYWIHVAVSYALLARAQYLMLAARPHIPNLASRSIMYVLTAWALPLAGNLATIFIIGPHGPDVTPFGFVVMAVILWRAVVYGGLIELVPIARAQVFEHLGDAVFVTDTAHNLVDANAKARALAGLDHSTGTAGQRGLSELSPLIAHLAAREGEHDVDLNGELRVLDVTITELLDRGQRVVGAAIHARDVTETTLQRRELIRVSDALADEARMNERLRHELADQVVRDAGTGLLNRRYVFETLPDMAETCGRDGSPLSVILMDLDYFKDVNDTYGHAVGDRVLQVVAAAMSEAAGDTVVARFGGEEFIVLLPGVDASEAAERAEAIRAACAGASVQAREGEVAVTVSAGVATSTSGDVEPSKLIEAADKALYAAKHSGRNTTCVAAAFSGA